MRPVFFVTFTSSRNAQKINGRYERHRVSSLPKKATKRIREKLRRIALRPVLSTPLTSARNNQ